MMNLMKDGRPPGINTKYYVWISDLGLVSDAFKDTCLQSGGKHITLLDKNLHILLFFSIFLSFKIAIKIIP